MDTHIEEKYASMRLAHGDITSVIDLLHRARTEGDTSIKSALVRYCIIEYAKPFKVSKGVFQRKFRPLDEESVFPDGNADHKALIAERDQRIAHGDITAFRPQLHYWSQQDIFPIVLKSSHLYDIDEVVEKMLVLCEIVRQYLTDQMRKLEAAFREQIKNKEDDSWRIDR